MIFDRVTDSAEQRLKNVLISDKQFCPDRVQKVLKSDAYNMNKLNRNIIEDRDNVLQMQNIQPLVQIQQIDQNRPIMHNRLHSPEIQQQNYFNFTNNQDQTINLEELLKNYQNTTKEISDVNQDTSQSPSLGNNN